MNTPGLVTLLLLIANTIVSWKGFRDPAFFASWSLEVEQVRLYKRYNKLLTAGFLHVNWMHLVFNLIAIYSFGNLLGLFLGSIGYLLVYLASLVGGNLYAVYANRHNPGYTTVGSSDAVCGMIFSSIALAPYMQILFIPAWLFGLLFVGFTIYGIQSGSDNKGKEAHLVGALTGMVVTLLFNPSSLADNTLPILAVALPSLIFIVLMIKRPGALAFPGSMRRKQAKVFSIDQRYNLHKKDEEKDIDRILEKVHRKGMNSLSKAEKDKLNDYSSK